MPTMTEHRPDNEWVTVAELADHFGVSKDTIYRWAKRDTAPASIKFGKYRLFRRTDVRQWIKEQYREQR